MRGDAIGSRRLPKMRLACAISAGGRLDIRNQTRLHDRMLRLVRPAVGFHETFLDGLRTIDPPSECYSWVYLGDAADLSYPERDFAGYVETLLRSEHVAPPEFVRGVTYWGIENGRMIGRLGLRLELNDMLARAGGHVGYYVHPAARRRGFATEMLRQALRMPEARAIGRLLLTCDEGNAASERTIRVRRRVRVARRRRPGQAAAEALLDRREPWRVRRSCAVNPAARRRAARSSRGARVLRSSAASASAYRTRISTSSTGAGSGTSGRSTAHGKCPAR